MDFDARAPRLKRDAPELDEVVDVTFDDNDAFNWIFPVDDGHVNKLALSCEYGGAVYVARIDPLALKTGIVRPSWHKLFEPSDMKDDSLKYYSADLGTPDNKFTRVADHWHIFAHGYHWIACSISGDTEDDPVGVYLVKFTLDGSGVPTVIWKEVVKTAFDINDYYLYSNTDPYGVTTSHYSARWPTNDLFLVEAPDDCVAFGIYNRSKLSDGAVADPSAGITAAEPESDEGHYIVTVHCDYGWIKTDDTLSGGHTNGGSARLDSGPALGVRRYRALVPTSILVNYETKLLLIEADAGGHTPWIRQSLTTLLDGEGKGRHYSMAMEVELGLTGYTVMVVKEVVANTSGDDGGGVWMILYDRGGTQVGYTHVVALPWSGANRPHLCRWNGHVVVCWDDTGSCYMKVFEET